MEITGSAGACNFVPLVGENYAMKLKNSVQNLISEFKKESPDLSLYLDAFYELMQANVDPPFEAIWVYAGIKFRALKSDEGDVLDRISAAKGLFQILSACSASVGASKSMGLLVPVVCEVHKVLLELSGRELKLKREKKAMREVKSLVGVIVGYLSVCCSKVSEEDSDCVDLNMVLDFSDLCSVWVNENNDGGDGFESLLPLVGSDVCQFLCEKGFHVGYLGGAVIMEVFFLKLCLIFHQKTPGDELEVNLKSSAVGSISSFQNIYFFEILLRAALGTSLPLSSILKPEDETMLRKVLFDAVLLVEYPFLFLNAKCIKNLTLTKLVVTHEAVEYCRGLGDQNRAISYIREFSASPIALQIIKLVTSQNGLEEKSAKANGSSPRALLSWLMSLEKRGIRVFEDDTLRSRAKLSFDNSQAEQLSGNLEGKIADDDLFYVDNVGEEGNEGEEDKQNELISDAFIAAAQTMNSSDSASRKRKGKSNERMVKFVKYDIIQNSGPAKDVTSAGTDSSSSEREVEDPDSDTDS